MLDGAASPLRSGAMPGEVVTTGRLELRPLPADVAACLPGDRAGAEEHLGLSLPASWPQPDLLDVLPLQASASAEDECYGVWLMVDAESHEVVGDIGFMGPPGEEGTVEIGYSVVPERRRLGYASGAVAALVTWAFRRGVRAVVAGCDPGNEASIRVLEGGGFHRTAAVDGELRWRLDNPATA